MNPIVVFLLFLIVRVASVFIVKTFYVPDEYWQSLEVAHKLAFGYGYLTWEWTTGIRSYIYPAIIAGIYKLLALAHLDLLEYLVICPRIFQALISSFADYRFYVWTGKKKWAIFLLAIQFFWFYCGSRTLANTFEAALSTIALSYYPFDKRDKTSYLWFVGLCCYIRPTAAIVWLPLVINHLLTTQVSTTGLIFKKILPIGLITLGLGLAVDTYFYGRIIFTPWEFLKFNYFHNIGSFYGTHPWYWYFLVGLPTVLGINLLPFLIGIIQSLRYRDVYPIRNLLLIVITVTLIAYSLVAHKEFRFILILLPICLYICVDSIVRWSYKASKWLLWLTALLLLIGNLGPAYILSSIVKTGPIEVMPFLAEISKQYVDENGKRANILFLMPCHSTPFYSHIHQNVTLRFLTCQPNLKNQTNYVDEADQFYQNPEKWLRSHLPSYPKTAKPSHIVSFDILEKDIGSFYQEDYFLLDRIFYSQISSEWDKKINRFREKYLSFLDIRLTTSRIGRFIDVYERKGPNHDDEDAYARFADEPRVAELKVENDPIEDEIEDMLTESPEAF